MQKLLQLGAGFSAMFWLAPRLYGTPFHHWAVYASAGLGAAYGLAMLAAHWGPLSRGAADRLPGKRLKGRFPNVWLAR